MILQELNAKAEGIQVLDRNQVNVVLKLAPRREGNAIDQKALEIAMRKAFTSLGPQKLVVKHRPHLEDVVSSLEKEVDDKSKRVKDHVRINEESVAIGEKGVGKESSHGEEGGGKRKAGSGNGDHQTSFDKNKLGKELTNQLAWLNSFDSRFDECQKKLEVVRDQAHLGGVTRISRPSAAPETAY